MYCHFLFATLKLQCTRLPREETLPTSFSSDVGVEERGKEGAKGRGDRKMASSTEQIKEKKCRKGKEGRVQRW